jgi:hypothetical protein
LDIGEFSERKKKTRFAVEGDATKPDGFESVGIGAQGAEHRFNARLHCIEAVADHGLGTIEKEINW